MLIKYRKVLIINKVKEGNIPCLNKEYFLLKELLDEHGGLVSTQNYSTYSYSELLDVSQNIDKEAFPERYKEIQKLLSEKEPEEEIEEPFIENANWLPKLISVFQILCGVGGAYAIYDFLAPYTLDQVDTTHRILYGTMSVYFLSSIVAGFYLYLNMRAGYISSLVIQSLQVISFSISKVSYSITSWLLIEFSIEEGFILGARFDLNTIGFNILYRPDGIPFMFAVNITALFFVYVLSIHFVKSSSNKSLKQDK
ncbi:hypothetical protein [Thalassotalea sp. PLHSN55]|uniref:hypothetical protein n=1 Tax=Thalassotalea sp. PLHSN55 TaxID=3435888 RepID=UPI003F844E03